MKLTVPFGARSLSGPGCPQLDDAESYRSGTSAKVLAAQFGVHRHTVAEVMKRVGVERHSRGLTSAQVAKASGFYRDGWSLAKVAHDLGCHRQHRAAVLAPGRSGHAVTERAAQLRQGRSRSESPVGSALRPAFPGKVSLSTATES